MNSIGDFIIGFQKRHPELAGSVVMHGDCDDERKGDVLEHASESDLARMLHERQRDAFIETQLEVIPPRFRSAKWDDFDDPDRMGRLAIESGMNVLLIGKTGVGKTHAAAAAAMERMEAGMSIGWLNTAKWLYLMRESFGGDMKRESMRDFEKKQFIVIDDIGIENNTVWASETLNVLVNSIYEVGAQIFVTSNLTVQELAKRLGPRVAGRVVEGAEIITCTGDNRRIAKGR
jgi:DNA replication protein DnaC